MVTPSTQYYSRDETGKEFEEHRFIAGRGLQSAELNEIQKRGASRLKSVADALFRDGDVVRDAQIIVDQETGVVRCQSGAVYLRGAVRGVAPSTITIPLTGTIAVGVRLFDSVVTALEDPTLLDPATGTRNYGEDGAERAVVHAQWGWQDDGLGGQFFPVYTVTDGFLNAKETPPALDPLVQALARYDRDSAGGLYVVSGLEVKALPDEADGTQAYSMSEGRARVYGYGVDFQTGRRLRLQAVPDLRHVANEPHLSTTADAQRVLFDRAPAKNLQQVSITSEKTVSLVHGVVTGAQDSLPDTSVLALIEVKQGATTYASPADYKLTAGKVDWLAAGAEPAPGSTYTVKYQYIQLVDATAVDKLGFTVADAVPGTLILATYDQMLPRFDRLCIDQDGAFSWSVGIASDTNPQLPNIPGDQLPLASVYQDWSDTPRVVINDGVRVVPMPQIASIFNRLDRLTQLIAQQRLESDIHTRETGTKKGLFTDPFLDETQRDAGITQTGAIVNGELVLPISADVFQVGSDIGQPAALPYNNVVVLEQPLRTGSMNINPYQSFALLPARLTLTPDVDRWTETTSEWLSPITTRFNSGQGSVAAYDTTTVTQALVNTADSNLEFLRQIPVSYRIEGFGPGEALNGLAFDGVVITTPSLTADANGVITGSFTIPPNVPSGAKLVVVRSAGGLLGRATFTGQGTLERKTYQSQTSITTVWTSPPPASNTGTGGRAVVGPSGASAPQADSGSTIFWGPFGPFPISNDSWVGGSGGSGDSTDPLAQTFTLEQNTQISGIDLWFTALPTTQTRVQIRETSNGYPTRSVLVETIVPPSSIVADGTPTRVSFVAPQMLIAGVEYAFVVLCNDGDGALAIAELGKFDPIQQQWITSQPYTVGVLLSSSNASTWTAHQDRDLAFRLLGASYTSNARTIALGNVTVAGATDLLLMSFADRPASLTQVDYTLTLPDASVLVVADGQPVQLPAPITGDIAVAARLGGLANASPLLFPGTQIAAGIVAAEGDYVTRAVPAGSAVTIKLIYEALLPSGSSVTATYRGVDAGDVWSSAIPITANSPADDGFTEFQHTITGVTELAIQVRLQLAGNTAARPRVRDLRVIVL